MAILVRIQAKNVLSLARWSFAEALGLSGEVFMRSIYWFSFWYKITSVKPERFLKLNPISAKLNWKNEIYNRYSLINIRCYVS